MYNRKLVKYCIDRNGIWKSDIKYIVGGSEHGPDQKEGLEYNRNNWIVTIITFILIGCVFFLYLAAARTQIDKIFLYCLYLLVNGRSENRKMYLTGMVYALMPAVFGLGQIYMIDVSMYSLGFSLSICLIFVFDKTRKIEQYLERTHREERGEQLSIINSLAGDFSTIYSVR